MESVSKKGTVFDIQKFSTNDGPGIRTTVFLKGCPLRCLWCHNPESQKKKPELSFEREKCRLCTRCVQVCQKGCIEKKDFIKINRENCNVCGACTEYCYSHALTVIGKEMSTDEIMTEVMKDNEYYKNSEGGITLSGGEPMFQSEFTLDILKKAKENNLHTCIETSGFCEFEKLKKCYAYTDIFLYDIKETDSKKHREFTGAGNEEIITNLIKLDNLGAKIILRCPIIPGMNDRSGHFKTIAELANRLKNILEINIEPYHPMGKKKCEYIGKKNLINGISFVNDELSDRWIKEISDNTKIKVIKA